MRLVSQTCHQQQQQQQQHQHQNPFQTQTPFAQSYDDSQPDPYNSQFSPFLSVSDFDLDLNLDLDLDFAGEAHCFSSSSPASTASFSSRHPSIQGSPLVPFGDVPTGTIPREAQDANAATTATLAHYPPTWTYPHAASSSDSVGGGDWEIGQGIAGQFASDDDLMQTDSLFSGARLTPKSAARVSHNRESSLSSLGSAGPASPYSHNTANPHIAVTDTVGDEFPHSFSNADEPTAYQFSKPLPQDAFYAHYPNYTPTNLAAPAPHPSAAMSVAYRQKRRSDQRLLPPPDLQSGSRPVSVASSIVSDSPATPAADTMDDERRRKTAFNNSSVPRLGRTITDAYGDELYSPGFDVTASASPAQAAAAAAAVSPSRSDLFTQRLQAANSQHLNHPQSPVSASPRDGSPFRQGSPLAPGGVSHDFPPTASSAPNVAFSSARQMRERMRAREAQAVQQHLSRRSDNETPQTISPKDAVLDFHQPEGDVHFPLFPQHEEPADFGSADLKGLPQTSQPFDGMALDTGSFGDYVTTTPMQASIPVPQQYPFIPQKPRHQQQQQQQQVAPPLRSRSLAPSRLSSADSGQSDQGVHSNGTSTSSPPRPAGTGADGGTYTCTYHGCTMRFETPALLQKHKREGHRQAHGLIGQRGPADPAAVSPPGGMTSSLINSQAGPHRCDRINPSTGKPCETIFSRPYDLTRHEDTIHNARKQKVRCNLCADEKTFSRADALTRHYRVCHPEVELPGKHRKRGGQSV